MNTLLMVCMVIVTVAFVALVVQAILTLRQVRHTAQAAEYLALNADGKLTALDPVIDGIKSVSSAVSSGWFRLAQIAYKLFTKE